MQQPKPKFLQIATPLIELGYRIVPLDGKSPHLIGESWQLRASTDRKQIAEWANKFPNANVGVVICDEYHIIDVDNWAWFAEATEHLPPLYATLAVPITPIVQTGSGLGLHIYIKGKKPAWARPIKNPKFKSKEETPDEKPALLEYPTQVVGPGSVHPITNRIYTAFDGFSFPKDDLPKAWLDWLQSLYAKDLSPQAFKCRPLKPGQSLQKVLESTELAGKYDVLETADRVFYNYHVKLGRCLVKGSSHRETSNNAHCGFFSMKKDPRDWGHHCQSAKCQVVQGGQRKAALAGLGLALEDVLRPKWRDEFSSKSELNQRPLEFVVERLVPEEGITGIGGPSGMGKTYMMLSMAKAISTGALLWGFLKVKRCPALYLLAEGGDRALNKRLGELLIGDSEDLLVRTMSKGRTLPLNDPNLRFAANGRVVLLDTFPRWLNGRDENAATQMAELFQLGLDLLTAGAVAIVLAQHSIKGSKKNPWTMTPECVFRGSGDILANMAAAHGIYQLDNQAKDKTLIHIECVKARDFEPLQPFQLQGKPYINTEGDFRCVKEPGQCGWFQQEKKSFLTADKDSDPRLAQVQALTDAGKTQKEIANELGCTVRTVQRILKSREPEVEEEADEHEQMDLVTGEIE